MQVINVIETTNGVLKAISSWYMEDASDKKVALAEEHYVSCVRNNRSDYDELPEKSVSNDLILEEDSFDNKAGYTVQIVWSHTVE